MGTKIQDFPGLSADTSYNKVVSLYEGILNRLLVCIY